MSLEDDYQLNESLMDRLGSKVVQAIYHHKDYIINSLKEKKGDASKFDIELMRKAREGLRESLRDAKTVLDDLIKNYPI